MQYQPATAASMGPGRLTGMNASPVALAHDAAMAASMGPGRLTGMNDACNAVSCSRIGACFNGARSIDRDERRPRARAAPTTRALQWGPVD